MDFLFGLKTAANEALDVIELSYQDLDEIGQFRDVAGTSKF